MTGFRLVPVVLTLLLLTACIGGEPGPEASGSQNPSPDASGGSQQPPEQTTAQKLTETLLEGDERPKPVATVRGAIALPQGSAPVEVDILAVQANAQTTLLRWRLRSGTGQPLRVRTSSLAAPNLFDTRAVALADATGNQRLLPFTYRSLQRLNVTGCTCSEVPESVSADGVQLYALFPPLAPEATTVDVLIPGLPPAEKIQVTR